MSDIVIGGESISLGQTKTVRINLAKSYDRSSMELIIKVIRGKKPGPTLFVTAAIHGDELCGIEIIRRIMKRQDLKNMSGTLLLIPVVNVFGFNTKSRYLPDGRDLNRSFPGGPKGSVASQIAHILTKEVIQKSDYGIDLHTGAKGRSNVPQIRANIDCKETKDIAEIFGVPTIINAKLRDGSLRETAQNSDVPVLLYEAGEALRYDESSIRKGMNGVLNVMGYLKMIKRPMKKALQEVFHAESSAWIRAPHSGLFRGSVRQGIKIKKGQKLGVISDPYGNQSFDVISSYTGMVIGKLQNPLVNKGDAVFHVAAFDELDSVEDAFEEYDYGFDAVTPKKYVE